MRKTLSRKCPFTSSAQLGLPLDDAYRLAVEVMAESSGLADAQEGMAAFVEKRPPVWR